MFKDDRGKGIYDIFKSIPQGQVNLSITYPGVIRAFHMHHKQTDNWYLVSGDIEVGLQSEDINEPIQFEYLSGGEDRVLSIPPGIWHGFKVLGNQPAILLYYVTEKFNPTATDEERVEWNAFTDWETEFK